MPASSRTIYVNEATAAKRTVTFSVFNTDGTAKTDLSATTALIHADFDSGTASTANFAHAFDQYYTLVLTQAEVNLAANTHLLIGPADATGYVVVRGEAVIIDPPLSEPVEANIKQINDVAITGDGSATPFDV
jgi:hypothetical protein